MPPRKTIRGGALPRDAHDYANVVAATPHFEPSASRVVWIVFAAAALSTAVLAIFWLAFR